MSRVVRSASRWNTLFTTTSSRAELWLITIRPPRNTLRWSRSQVIESASRWLVGSSSSRVCAPENRILVSSTRRRCPPDRVTRGWDSTRPGSPRLAAMDAASDSAAYPPRPCSRSSALPYRRTAASLRADLVPGGNLEARRLEQQLRTGTQLQAACHDH